MGALSMIHGYPSELQPDLPQHMRNIAVGAAQARHSKRQPQDPPVSVANSYSG